MQRHVQASFFGGFGSGLFHLTHANQILSAHLEISIYEFPSIKWERQCHVIWRLCARLFRDHAKWTRWGWSPGPPYAERVSPTTRTGDQEKQTDHSAPPAPVQPTRVGTKRGARSGSPPALPKGSRGAFRSKSAGEKKPETRESRLVVRRFLTLMPTPILFLQRSHSSVG